MKSSSQSPPVLRREALFDALLTTVDQLRRRRAADIPAGYIDDYVALDWLEWNGGGLQLTETGDRVCKQITRDLSWPQSH